MGYISPGGTFKAIGREFGAATYFNLVVNTHPGQHIHTTSCTSSEPARSVTLVDMSDNPSQFRDKFRERYRTEPNFEPLSRELMVDPSEFLELCDQVSF